MLRQHDALQSAHLLGLWGDSMVSNLALDTSQKRQDEVQAIFSEELGKALKDPEVVSALAEVRPSGLDSSYLKQHCLDEYETSRKSSTSQEEYSFYRRRAMLENANKAALLYRISTSPAVLRSGIIAALGLAIGSFAMWHPGFYHAEPNELLVLLAACAAILALAVIVLAQLRINERWILDKISAVLTGGAIGLFWAGILTVHKLGKPPHGNPSIPLIYLFWLIFIVTAVVPFSRVAQRAEKTSPTHLRLDLAGSALMAAGFSVLPLASLWAGSRNSTIVTAKPSSVLLALAIVMAIVTCLFSLGGLGRQPLSFLRERYEKSVELLRQYFSSALILPSLRRAINEQIPSYSDKLEVGAAPGLSEQFHPKFEVSTSSRNRIDRVLERLPTGGSLGLAGPRGSGKSTLLRSYCGEYRQDPDNTLAVLLSAPVEYTSRDFLLHLYATLCRSILKRSQNHESRSERLRWSQARFHVAVVAFYGLLLIVTGTSLIVLQVDGLELGAAQLWGIVILLIGLGFAVQAALRGQSSGIRSSLRTSTRQSASLEEAALEKLDEIRFQQTISATWSGSIKTPMGFEGTYGGGQSLVRQAMLLPEIVDSLREFLETAANGYDRVMIGIDELDKMESDEHAKEFLNEIKGVFSAKGCHFMVSVSEDAIGSFERRGIPFRDVFDSSFDEVIHVRCLSFEEAETILNRRVTLMPVQFKGLCYCLSGGVSRDLIRAARGSVEASFEVKDNPTLPVITRLVLSRDLRGKAAAISAAMSAIDLEPQVSDVLYWVQHVSIDDLVSGQIQTKIDQLEKFMTTAADHSDQLDGDLLLLRRLTAEFAGYCYYLGTLLDIFYNKETSRLAEEPKHDYEFDKLVVGRQQFTVNTLLAWKEISEYRKIIRLTELSPPRSLQGGSPAGGVSDGMVQNALANAAGGPRGPADPVSA